MVVNINDIKDIYYAYGWENKKVMKKAELLRYKYHNFKWIPQQNIIQILRNMRNKRKYKEYTEQTIVGEQESVNIALLCDNDKIFDRNLSLQRRIVELQRNYKELQQKCDKVVQELSHTKNNMISIQIENKKMKSLSNYVDIIIDKLNCKDLSRRDYQKLMKSVLHAIKLNDDGHLCFDIKGHKIYATICNVFKTNNHSDPDYRTLSDHTRNIDNFMNLKCQNDDQLKHKLFTHMVQLLQWKDTALSALKVQNKLTLKQTVIQFIESNQSLRRFCDQSSFCNKEFGHRMKADEVAIREARTRVQMQTEHYEFCLLEISEKEMQHNNNKKDESLSLSN